jgi:type I restriction enzyme M protein
MNLTTAQVIDRVFRGPGVKHGLAEFADLPKKVEDILSIYPKVSDSGRSRGEVRYYLKCFKRGIDIQVYSETKSNPEEIVRQLWLYKLNCVYGYSWQYIEVEYSVKFGTVTAAKAADILVFQKDGRTAKIVVEVKRPDRKDGINQLKSYLNAEGSPVGVWSNGIERVILYRPYPREFEDTLTEIPSFSQDPKDVLAAKLTLGDLKREFDFKRIIQNLEELVLANAGVDEFNEIFKIIFAKIYDEKAARERRNQELMFRKSEDPQITYETIDKLFRKAMDEWPGVFDENERIKLTSHHLQVCIGPIERIRLLGANMRIMDDAFEYLMPSVAKKKNGQFFTPRYVIDMCIKMLNPKRREHIVDPACGSAGFLIHTLDYVWPAEDDARKEERKHKYASKYLWGMDFDERSAKVSRALMLIAGDGRSHVFKVNSLDPREWFSSQEGEAFRNALRESNLLQHRPNANQVIRESETWQFYQGLKFDVLLTNPPFAGEMRDRELLKHYSLAESAITRNDKSPKEERDVLFIERCLDLLKPGGRLAIVLPQGKFSNSSLAYIREWMLRRSRLIAVVGLHPNTFKPHTGTKTSVLFMQKYTEAELAEMKAVQDDIQGAAPDYGSWIRDIVEVSDPETDLSEEQLPEEIAEILREQFGGDGTDEADDSETSDASDSKVDRDALAESLVEKRATAANLEQKLLELSGEKPSRKRNTASAADKSALKDEERHLKAALRAIEREALYLARQLARTTVRGQLSFLREDSRALAELKQKWIDNETAKRLNYPIFMASSELSGKDSSGEYVFRQDLSGVIVEDQFGNPLIEQDLVRYRLEDPPAIAESFVSWARAQNLNFWRDE